MDNEAIFFRQNKWLYHFTKFDVAKVIIRDVRLKYGLLAEANDACENRKSVYNAYSPQGEEKICEDIEREIYHYQQISLSEDKAVFGRRGFDLQQMWGIYADKGYGACLVFDKAEFLDSIPECCTYGSVMYSAETNSDSFTKVRNVNEIETYIKSNTKYLFFSKRKEWEHEQEYKIVNRFENEENEQYLNFNNSLKYITKVSHSFKFVLLLV